MSNRTDFTQLSRRNRLDVVTDAFRDDPDRAALALIGARHQSDKVSTRQRRAVTEVVVAVQVEVGAINGESLVETLYLSDDYLPNSMARRLGTLREAKVFANWRDGEKALAWYQDESDRNAVINGVERKPVAGEVVEYASVRPSVDLLSTLPGARGRTINGGLGL